MSCTPRILREEILAILDTNRTQFGLPADYMQITLRGRSVRATVEEIISALEYLCNRQNALVQEIRPEINCQERAWRITGDGIRYVDEHNL